MRGTFVLSVAVAQLATAQASGPASAPPVAVRDLIGMTLFGSDPHNGGIETDTQLRSPDGAHLAVLLQRGNLARNTVDYTLVVFRTADARRAPRPDTVASLASASNDPAISGVRWLADNRTLAFLGGPPREPAQVYTVDITNHTLARLTHSATGVTWFEIAPVGEPVIYQQRGAIDTSRYAAMRAHGFTVPSNVWVSDLIAGDWVDQTAKWHVLHPTSYRLARGGSDAPLTLPDSTTGHRQCEVGSDYGLPVSPRGGALLIVCRPHPRPVAWDAYRNASYRRWVDKFGDYGRELVRLDLTTGEARVVWSAPLPDDASFAWAPDGRSLLVANALLPLMDADSARRATQRMAAEIDVGTGAITVVAPRDSLVVQGWDGRSGIVELAIAPESWMVSGTTPRLYYRKAGRGWTDVPASEAAAAAGPRFIIDQGANTPPRLALVDPKTHATHLLLDPNPGLLAARRFGRVEVFHWTTKQGNTFVGGLYYPPDRVPGRRYPLVIQTHGFDSTHFAPGGVFTTDQAAQPLAAAGILVLQTERQVGGDKAAAFEAMETPAEGPFYQEVYEGAIDALDGRGLIDRGRIGLQGFSRTCFYTLYFLTHSSYPLAAADIADGVDYSYVQSLAFVMNEDKVNGGRPWGATQAAWLERASGFRLDRVTAPLRVTALQPFSLLSEWEPYAGLLLQDKPTELVYIPDGAHVLVKPWERLTSQQGVVDWWRFWLQGYEDPDPAKADQYARWHTLRAQRDSSALSSSSR